MQVIVKKTGEPITFYPKETIRIAEVSPIFEKQGVYSFPFDIPLDENKAALDFPSRLTKKGPREYKYDVSIKSRVIGDTDGIMIVWPKSNKIRVGIKIGYGEFDYKLNNTDLRDLIDDQIDLGNNTDEVIEYANNCITKTWPEVPFNFPVVHNSDFYENENNPTFKRINYYEPNSNTFLKNFMGSNNNIQNSNSLIPFLYISEIMTRIIEGLGFKHNDDFLTNDGINKVMLWNNQTLDSFHWPIVNVETYPVIWIQEDDMEYDPLNMIVNVDEDDLWSGSTGTVGNVWTPKVAGRYKFHLDFTYQENVPINHLLISVFKNGNFLKTFPGSSYQDTLMPNDGSSEIEILVTENDIAANASYSIVHYSYHVNPEDVSTSNYNVLWARMIMFPVTILNTYRLHTNLKNHVPDVKAADIYTEVEKLFGFATFKTKTNEVKLKYLKDIVTGHYLDDLSDYILAEYEIEEPDRISELSFNADSKPIDEYELIQNKGIDWQLSTDEVYKNNYLGYVRALLAYYLTTYELDPETEETFYNVVWERFTERFHPLKLQDNGDEISIGLEPAKTVRTTINPNAYTDNTLEPYAGIMPSLSEKAYSSLFRSFGDMKSIVFNWLGYMQISDDGSCSPTASAGSYNRIGEHINGIIDLAWDTDYSLYEIYYKEWVDFINNADMYKFNVLMPASKIQEINFWSLYRIKGIVGIIKKKEYMLNVSEDRIENKAFIEFLQKNN